MDQLAAQELRALLMHPRLQAYLPAPSQVTLEDVIGQLLPYGRVSFRQVDGRSAGLPAAHLIGCVLRLKHGSDEGEEPTVVWGVSALAETVVGSGATLTIAALRCLLALLEHVDREADQGFGDLQRFLASS
jgi:hypothetical protein